MKILLAVLIVCSCAVAHAAEIPAEPQHVVSLNGAWRFKLEQAKPPTTGPADWGAKRAIETLETFEKFYSTDFKEDDSWHDFEVPGNWEMAGYSPATYGQPDNTSGFFRKLIDIPADWNGREVMINFDGVQNGAEVWLNGEPVDVSEPSWGRKNYHESGWTAWQANLTSGVKLGHIKFGEKNLLAIRVTKNTKSADLDSGDYFFLGGIYRAVTLLSIPQNHIEDVKIETKLLPGAKAELKLIAKVAGEGASISAQLEGFGPMPGSGTQLTQTLDNPKLWSAEFPNLYNLTIDLKDRDGKVIEHLTRRVGIREVSIKGGVLLVNGVPVKLAGMCRHDCDATHGTAVGPELWRKDLELMRAANINAIRTSHYPYGSGFYDLCDEMGFYVVDELPYCWCPTDDKELEAAFLQRARETIAGDKNHPSVIIWAVGNENKEGSNLQSVADAIKSLDITRPRTVSWFNADKYGVELDDAHYTPPADVAKAAFDKSRREKWPKIYLENPNVWDVRFASDPGCWDAWGDVLKRTWDANYRSDGIVGTFIWEWQDRAVADKSPVKLYNFDEATGINYLKVKGIVDAFRNPRPEHYLLKMIYSPIQVASVVERTADRIKLHIDNRYSFTDLSQLNANWKLLAGGKEIAKGTLNPKLAPRTQADVDFAIPGDPVADTVRIDFDDARGWTVTSYAYSVKIEPKSQALTGRDAAAVSFPQFNLVVNETRNDKAKWRAITRLRGALINVKADPDDQRALTGRPIASVRSLDADVVLENAPKDVVAKVHATFDNGVFAYKVAWVGKKADIQELGWTFAMPKTFDRFSWKRQAPWTVYPDTHIGRSTGTAMPDSMNVAFTKMTRPDAFDFNSTKYRCDWATLTDAAGDGLRVDFESDERHQIRGGIGENDTIQLLVNRQASPPRDISSNCVPEYFLMLNKGEGVASRFSVTAAGAAK